jgi:hypothetical protein
MNPTMTLGFIGPTVDVEVAAGSSGILVVATKALGSTAAGGASGLQLAVCWRKGLADPLKQAGGGIVGIQVPQGARIPMGINAIVTGAALAASIPGTITVGMCGSAAVPGNWNSNEFGYVSAVVLP